MSQSQQAPNAFADQVLARITELRVQLQRSFDAETSARQTLHNSTESAKRIEDVVVQEIWSSDKYKNDRDRNAAKHLARINDRRIVQAQEIVQIHMRELASAQFNIIDAQTLLNLYMIQFEAAVLGRRDAGLQFMANIARIMQPDTTSSMGINAGTSFESAVAGNVTEHTAEFVAAASSDEAPTGRVSRPLACDQCGQPFVIADKGIRKGLPVHGDKMDCPSNAGSWMNTSHPNFRNAPDAVNSQPDAGASGARFENRREPYHVIAAREKVAERMNLAERLLVEGRAGWVAVGATQHFFGADGLALGVEGHRTNITLGRATIQCDRDPRDGITVCESCRAAAITFKLGNTKSAAAYGKPDEDAVLVKPGGKKVEKFRGVEL